MYVRTIENTLSDGSHTYDVVIAGDATAEGFGSTRLAAIDKASAEKLQAALCDLFERYTVD